MTSITNRSKFRLSPSSLLIGILIPIIAALIPYAIKIIYPEHQLVYEITGPITANQISAMGLVISNKGRKTEKNVKIWIEADFIGRKINPQDLIIESKSKYSILKDRDYYVISIGDIRPAEKISLSAIIPGSLYFIKDSYYPEKFSIKSDDHIAQNNAPSEFINFLYQFGFWMFILLMVLMGIWAIYFEFIMQPKKKEKYIIEQLEKVRKKIPEKNIE